MGEKLENKGIVKQGPMGRLGSAMAAALGEEVTKGIANECPKIKVVSEKLRSLFGPEADDLVLVEHSITTAERFSNFEDSLAHLMDDGTIMRYGEEIGRREDIEIVELEERS